MIFVLPWENVIVLPGLGTISKATGIIAAAFWVATLFFTGQIRRLKVYHIAVFLFVGWHILSILWTVNPNQTMSRIRTYSQMLIFILLLWDLYTTHARLRAGFQAYVLGAYVGIYSGVSNYLANQDSYHLRYGATGFNPDDIGVIIALGIPMAWYLVVSADKEKRLDTIWKVINCLYIPAALFGIALSGTRTALIATLPGFGFMFLSMRRLRPQIQLAIVAVVVIAVYLLLPLVPEYSLQRLASTTDEITSGTLNGRVGTWQAGWLALAERPILGIGSGAFRDAVPSGRVAHNVFLSTAVEVGLVGLILFVSVLAICGSVALMQARRGNLLWGVLLTTWLIGGMALSWEPRKQTWFVLTLTVAAAHLISPQPEKEEDEELPALDSFYDGPQPVLARK